MLVDLRMDALALSAAASPTMEKKTAVATMTLRINTPQAREGLLVTVVRCGDGFSR
jgi:hypothetical protein